MASQKNQLSIFDIIDEQESRKNLLTADHFDLKTRNPRFVYWLSAEGKRIGDEYRIYEFMIWINRKVCEYKKMCGFKDDTPMSHMQNFHSGFDKFLKNI